MDDDRPWAALEPYQEDVHLAESISEREEAVVIVDAALDGWDGPEARVHRIRHVEVEAALSPLDCQLQTKPIQDARGHVATLRDHYDRSLSIVGLERSCPEGKAGSDQHFEEHHNYPPS